MDNLKRISSQKPQLKWNFITKCNRDFDSAFEHILIKINNQTKTAVEGIKQPYWIDYIIQTRAHIGYHPNFAEIAILVEFTNQTQYQHNSQFVSFDLINSSISNEATHFINSIPYVAQIVVVLTKHLNENELLLKESIEENMLIKMEE